MAGLRYVRDTSPGIRRQRSGDRWTYVGPDDRIIHDVATLDRIRSLAIPPAYTAVWISPDPFGHIQATGRDARGRKQYHFGLTTLREEHVAVRGATMRFQFAGKEGKLYRCHVTDRRLARIVQRFESLPGQELFKYVDDSGELRTIGSGDVNDYVREITGEHFTAKDFRTWAGTMLAADALRVMEVPSTPRGINSAILRAIDRVAEQLNNTRAVSRKYYVHPAIFEAFASGLLHATVKSPRGPKPGVSGLDPFESEVVSLLCRRATDRRHFQT